QPKSKTSRGFWAARISAAARSRRRTRMTLERRAQDARVPVGRHESEVMPLLQEVASGSHAKRRLCRRSVALRDAVNAAAYASVLNSLLKSFRRSFLCVLPTPRGLRCVMKRICCTQLTFPAGLKLPTAANCSVVSEDDPESS